MNSKKIIDKLKKIGLFLARKNSFILMTAFLLLAVFAGWLIYDRLLAVEKRVKKEKYLPTIKEINFAKTEEVLEKIKEKNSTMNNDFPAMKDIFHLHQTER